MSAGGFGGPPFQGPFQRPFEGPPPQPQVEVRNLFPTPVAITTLPEAASINAALKPLILERERGQASLQHSNLGGWQSSWDFQDWGGPALGRVLDSARLLADNLTVDRQGKPARVAWRVNCWANVNRSGEGNEFHTHPGCFWSGTYYVDDGGIAAGGQGGQVTPAGPAGAPANALGGEFEVQDPRGVAPAMYAPKLTFAGRGGLAAGAAEMITPRAGMMILFPSWLQHAVRPYRGGGERISIAFNLGV